MLERCSPRYAPGVGCTRKDITRERKAPRPNWISNGIPIRLEPGHRGKTPDRAVGSPGHLGHLTPPPHEERQVSNPKKIEKKESFKQILRESMISRYWNWNMKMRRSVVLTSLE